MTLSEDMEVDRSPEAGIVYARSTRFLGTTQTCDLGEVSNGSLEGLQWLYHWLEAVGAYGAVDGGDLGESEVEALVSRDNVDRAVDCARNVRPAEEDSLRLSRIFHDLRGTALHQLVGLADLWLAGLVRINELRAIAILARDHAKVLRHSFVGLDEEKRLLDSGRRLHGVENLRSRFPFLVLSNGDEDIQVDFAAEWNGDFAITCPEFSTVLKQLYNLMDNAARHTADRKVLVRVNAKPTVVPRSVRLVVANTLTPTERAALSPEALARLWRGHTTTGSGLGLASCAALVAEAFGIGESAHAIDLGYVGSHVTTNGFVAWLHWPVVIDDTR